MLVSCPYVSEKGGRNVLVFGRPLPVASKDPEDLRCLLHELIVDRPRACDVLLPSNCCLASNVEAEHVSVHAVCVESHAALLLRWGKLFSICDVLGLCIICGVANVN